VFKAIAAGDGPAAASAMSGHFEAADQAIRELFPDNHANPPGGRPTEKLASQGGTDP